MEVTSHTRSWWMGYWKSWVVQLNASSQYGPWPGLEAGAVDVSYVYVLPCLVGVCSSLLGWGRRRKGALCARCETAVLGSVYRARVYALPDRRA